jgi:cyclic 2,3-diphosphoglycerate synthetase
VSEKRKVLVLIDGEHYPSVIKDALKQIAKNYRLVGAVFVGGQEKLEHLEALDFLSCNLFVEGSQEASLIKAINTANPSLVIDLSGEPILSYRDRFKLASLTLANGIDYQGADFVFRAPKFPVLARKPSISIIGTGKRIGKTAVGSYIGRVLKQNGILPVIVAMGRGGPRKPEVIKGDEININADYLLSISNSGKHAASDYFEDALMARVATIGCRRCGGGMVGSPYTSNVAEGVAIANNLAADIVIFEGSGAVLPPVLTDARVVVCGANQDRDEVLGYFGQYRLLISNLAILTNCEEEIISYSELMELKDKIFEINPGIKIVSTVFRPHPLENISRKKIFFVSTAPKWAMKLIVNYLEKHYNCQVAGTSCNLADRSALKLDLQEAKQVDLILTELKAASVDLVTAFGKKNGLKVVYCDNLPMVVHSSDSLSKEVQALAEKAIKDFSFEKN